MSPQAHSWVLQHGPRLEDIDRHGNRYGTKARGFRAVLSSIAYAANSRGEHSHPGQRNISEESLYGRSQVLAIIDELLAEGWLSVEEQGGGRGKATVYRIEMTRRNVQPLDPLEEGNRAVQDEKPRDSDQETARSSEETARSQRSDQHLRARQNNSNTKINEKNKRACEPSLFADAFDAFWSEYPRRNAKPDARKAWDKNVENTESVLTGLSRWVSYWKAAETEPKFIPYPATWLNRHGWDDEPPPAPCRNGREYGPLADTAAMWDRNAPSRVVQQ